MADAHPGALPAAEAAEAVNGHEAGPTREGGGTTEVKGHGGESGGLPQFRMEYWGGQIVWLLVLFALLYLLLSRVFVPRIRRILDQRDASIAEAVEGARQVRTESEAQARAVEAELAEGRARAQRTAAEAKTRSAAEAHGRQAEQEAELSARLAQAEARIRRSRDQAMGSVRDVAAETTAAIVERLTERAASPAEVTAALAAVSPRSA